MKHCSRNLRQHIKILKQQYNRLYNTVLNNDKVSLQDVKEFEEHYRLVKDLLKTEKARYFNKSLKQM